MTADLELWLRGLWRHPNPCRHLHVIETMTPLMGNTVYVCRDCSRRATVTAVELANYRMIGRLPALRWEMA